MLREDELAADRPTGTRLGKLAKQRIQLAIRTLIETEAAPRGFKSPPLRQ